MRKNKLREPRHAQFDGFREIKRYLSPISTFERFQFPNAFEICSCLEKINVKQLFCFTQSKIVLNTCD